MVYSTGIKCGTISLVDLGALCNQTQGFEEDYVPCGKQGTFVTCQAVGPLTSLICTPNVSSDPPVQQCQ
jgi:hypothetical protein